MKKEYFKGVKEVYSFTFLQNVKRSGYIAVTALIAIVILVGISFAMIGSAAKDNKKGQEDDFISPIQEVYMIDETGYIEGFEGYVSAIDATGMFKNTVFYYVDYYNDAIESIMEEVGSSHDIKTVILHISKDAEGILAEAIIPEGASYKESDAEQVLSYMQQYFESSQLFRVLNEDQIEEFVKPVITSYATIGRDDSVATQIIKIFAPMVFGLVLYMMLILYGQTIAKEVSTEKTSKLMESLLVSVHPYSLIIGKVLAIATVAVVQFFIWIASAAVGLFGGNLIAQSMYPEYENGVISLITFLRDNIGESAFSMSSFFIALVIFVVGFLFYCVLAGLAGCIVVKPEDAANANAVFVFPIVISFMLSYFSSLMGKDALVSVLRYIPFTSPFIVPVELITGTIGIAQGIISALILLVFSFVFITIAVRIYKGLVLYTGQKVNFKLIGNILKSE